jgi:hypothetical protein
MAPRTTHLYRALALYSNGLSRDVTEQAAWTTSDTSVATVSDVIGVKGTPNRTGDWELRK